MNSDVQPDGGGYLTFHGIGGIYSLRPDGPRRRLTGSGGEVTDATALGRAVPEGGVISPNGATVARAKVVRS